jgi:ribosome biogenesis protein UTP30
MTLHDQISRAVAIFQQLGRKDEEELIPDDPVFSLIFHLWDRYEATSPFPITIDIRHPIYAESVYPVRVITKDPHEEWKTKFRDALPPFTMKSYSLTKWRKKFTTAAERRQLIKETRLFVADQRIGHLLPKALGADFFQKKRTPVMVDLSGEDVVGPILEVLGCATAVLPKAEKFGVAIGKVSWEVEQLADNACDVIEGVFEKIGKEKVAAVFLRTPGSMSLPVYTADISQISREEGWLDC